MHLRFVVASTGRVSDCDVTRSSGSRALDETTCRLIMQRFRYRPARDGAGRPIADTIRGEHVWELGPEPPPIEVEPEEYEEESRGEFCRSMALHASRGPPLQMQGRN